MADYGAYVILCQLPVGYGKAETCCYDWAGHPPPAFWVLPMRIGTGIFASARFR